MHRDDTSLLKIAGGVALGIAAFVGGCTVIAGVIAARATADAEREFEAITQAARASQEEAMRQALRRQAKTDQAAEAARRETATHQRQLEAEHRIAIDQKTLKEEAWADFYKRPKRCENPPTTQALVECANEHIRAKRDFEKQYADGKL